MLEGHQPLLLLQNATIRDSAQVSQVTSTKPNLGPPQVRKRSTSRFTREGIEFDTSGQPRRKASCSTDLAGARRRPATASPTSSVYCPPLTSPAGTLGQRRGAWRGDERYSYYDAPPKLLKMWLALVPTARVTVQSALPLEPNPPREVDALLGGSGQRVRREDIGADLA